MVAKTVSFAAPVKMNRTTKTRKPKRMARTIQFDQGLVVWKLCWTLFGACVCVCVFEHIRRGCFRGYPKEHTCRRMSLSEKHRAFGIWELIKRSFTWDDHWGNRLNRYFNPHGKSYPSSWPALRGTLINPHINPSEWANHPEQLT